MLDKCAVAGDVTQALDRRGVQSVAITVIGGTEGTAVVLKSADTADGTFSDFVELVSASDASASQYKGFVVDLEGAKKFIKVTGATMATAVFGDCDYDVKKVTIKAGEIPSGADIEATKEVTIDVSTYTEPVEIEPTEGKDGMKKATVTLSNIPSGGSANVYSWTDNTLNKTWWFNFSVSPENKDEFENSKFLSITSYSQNDTVQTDTVQTQTMTILSCSEFFGEVASFTFTKVNDKQFIMNYNEQDITFTYDSTKDFWS